MTTDWRVSIKDAKVKPASEFLNNPFNYKIHTAIQDTVVEASLDELGWVRDVLINVTTGHIIDGHHRVSLAMRKGETTLVPYSEVELTEEQELLALSLLDPVISLAVIEQEQLARLHQAIQSDDERIMDFLAQYAQENNALFEQVANNGSSLDFSEFTTPQNPILRYRLIVENLSYEDVQRMMTEIPNSRFEQYRADGEIIEGEEGETADEQITETTG